MSMRPVTEFVTGTSGNAVMVPLEYMGGAFLCSIQVVCTGTAVFEVDATLDPANDFVTDPNAAANSNGLYTAPVSATTGNWAPVTGLTAMVANTYQGNLAFPAIALRLRCTTTGTGYAVLRVLCTSVMSR
jgi:hypothetical protein